MSDTPSTSPVPCNCNCHNPVMSGLGCEHCTPQNPEVSLSDEVGQESMQQIDHFAVNKMMIELGFIWHDDLWFKENHRFSYWQDRAAALYELLVLREEQAAKVAIGKYKVMAIKALHELTGASLTDSKDFYDNQALK